MGQFSRFVIAGDYIGGDGFDWDWNEGTQAEVGTRLGDTEQLFVCDTRASRPVFLHVNSNTTLQASNLLEFLNSSFVGLFPWVTLRIPEDFDNVAQTWNTLGVGLYQSLIACHLTR